MILIYRNMYGNEISRAEQKSSVFRSFEHIMTSKVHLNVYEAVSPILAFARWTGVLPLYPCIKVGKHSTYQCCFEISKSWTIFSIVIQVMFIPFVVILVMDLILGFTQTEVLWNSMKIMFLIHEVEMYAILIIGVTQVKQMSKILHQLTTPPSSPEDIKWIGRFMKIILTTMLLFFSLYSSANILHIWFDRHTIEIFSLKNFSRSIIGLFLHNYLPIFTQAQCLFNVLLCLLISSKYKYLSNLIRTMFNRTTHPIILGNQNSILIQPKSISTINKKSIFKIDCEYLDNLYMKYCEINDCLDNVNKRIGFQLLISISVVLYTLIFFIFCQISVGRYNNDPLIVFTSIFGTCVLITRLWLYMWMGQKVKEQSTEPLKALQRAKLLQYSQEIQQQLQILLLQWASNEPCYLTAFHIMNVGPWLVTSIIGNVITYLLVFIQISKSRD